MCVYISFTLYDMFSVKQLAFHSEANHYFKQTISNEQRTPGDGSPVTQGQFSDKMPDAVLNTMLKTQGSGTPKPFAYITGGIDLKEFKEKKKYVFFLQYE